MSFNLNNLFSNTSELSCREKTNILSQVYPTKKNLQILTHFPAEVLTTLKRQESQDNTTTELALITFHGCLGFSGLWLKNTAVGRHVTIQNIILLFLQHPVSLTTLLNDSITQISLKTKPLAFPTFSQLFSKKKHYQFYTKDKHEGS